MGDGIRGEQWTHRIQRITKIHETGVPAIRIESLDRLGKTVDFVSHSLTPEEHQSL